MIGVALRYGACVGVVLLSGCALVTPADPTAWGVSDPPYLSPYREPLGQAAPVPHEAGPTQTLRPGLRGVPPQLSPTGPLPPVPRGDRTPPATQDREAPQDGPRLGPLREVEPARLALAVSADEPRRQRGSAVTFSVEVANTGDEMLTGVVLEAEFDETLILPGHEETKVRQTLGPLAAGETKRAALTLSSDSVGRHCCRFTVQADGVEPRSRTVCVDYVPRRLSVSLSGPAQRTVSERAEWTLTLSNSSAEDLTGLVVRMAVDPQLVPVSLPADVQQTAEGLTWTVGTLAPGQETTLRLAFRCAAVADSACLVVEVTADGVPSEPADGCVKIINP